MHENLEIIMAASFGIVLPISYTVYQLFKVKQNSKIDEKSNEKISLDSAKKALDILDDLIKYKFEYYLYKEILPMYIGNESNKKEVFKKKDFIDLKTRFFNDIKISLSNEAYKDILRIHSKTGIEIMVHQKFSTLFNKIDSKFLNKEDDFKDNMFFMSEINKKLNQKGK